MQDKYNQFFNLYNGKPVEVEDPTARDQCMDLAFAWCDFIKIPRDTIRHQYAYQVWTMPTATTKQYFDMVPNSATNVPPVGALVVFGTTVGPAGHISIAAPGTNATNLVSFDQNWAGAQYARVITHTRYSGVVGWLQPKQTVEKMISSTQILSILNGPGSDGDKLIAIRKLTV